MSLVWSLAWPISFCGQNDDGHCDRIHSSLTPKHCFDDGYVPQGGKPARCFEIILCRALVQEIPGKHKWVNWSTQYNRNNVESSIKQHTINHSTGLLNHYMWQCTEEEGGKHGISWSIYNPLPQKKLLVIGRFSGKTDLSYHCRVFNVIFNIIPVTPIHVLLEFL